MLREYNRELLRDGFVVLPWLTNTTTNVIMRHALETERMLTTEDEKTTQRVKVTMYFDACAAYNMRILERMTGMEWIPLKSNDHKGDNSIGVYYNCIDTEYSIQLTCSCSCGLHNMQRQGSFNVVVPSCSALVVYHSPCLRLHPITGQNEICLFGSRYENIGFEPYDVCNTFTDKTENMAVNEILEWILEEDTNADFSFISDSTTTDPLFQFLKNIGIEENGVW